MIRGVEKKDVRPVCPHCKQQIEEVWFQAITGVLGKRYLYLCASCRACLGVSHRKGFWMG